jgi:osmotically-inducible protein OsmY
MRAGWVFPIVCFLGCASVDHIPYSQEDEARDQKIASAVREALNSDRSAFLDHVEVSARRGVVWLSGLTFSREDAEHARLDATKVDGVISVVEDINISANTR